jgi:hypothetical protein
MRCAGDAWTLMRKRGEDRKRYATPQAVAEGLILRIDENGKRTKLKNRSQIAKLWSGGRRPIC